MANVSAEPARQAQYDISAIIANYNGAALLPRCISALREGAGSRTLEIVLVDNASTDGSADLPCLRGDDVRVIRLDENAGFGRANNIGAEAASGAHLLLLNTDCFVRPGLLDALAARLEGDGGCAVAGPRLLNRAGTLQPSCHNFPAPMVLFLEQSLLWKALRRVPVLRHRLHIASPHNRPEEVDWLLGACLLVRAEAYYEVGGFDPAFYFYWEEADLCMRLQKAGWAVAFEPLAEAVHLGGGSTSNPAMLLHFFTSLFLFYSRHYSPGSLRRAKRIVRLMAWFKAARSRAMVALGVVKGAARRRERVNAGLWARVARL
jgi:GT2 family glycosyltransferase